MEAGSSFFWTSNITSLPLFVVTTVESNGGTCDPHFLLEDLVILVVDPLVPGNFLLRPENRHPLVREIAVSLGADRKYRGHLAVAQHLRGNLLLSGWRGSSPSSNEVSSFLSIVRRLMKMTPYDYCDIWIYMPEDILFACAPWAASLSRVSGSARPSGPRRRGSSASRR